MLQDFVYAYDLAGNILVIKDRTPNSGIPNTVLGINKLDRMFTYDPLYRLLSATGRESDLQPQSAPWLDGPQSQDPTKTRAYQQTYTYDAGNNLTRLHHESTAVTFNRDFAIVPGSNRLANVTDTGLTRAYVYDVNGNLIARTQNVTSSGTTAIGCVCIALRLRTPHHRCTPVSL